MYVPEYFAAADADALIERLSRARAGLLITTDAAGAPYGTHLPLVWDPGARTLTGHIARANPHHALTGGQALVVLSGPETYVSPGLYPSKAEHGRAVPTWNYEAAHLSGEVEWFSDPARLEAV